MQGLADHESENLSAMIHGPSAERHCAEQARLEQARLETQLASLSLNQTKLERRNHFLRGAEMEVRTKLTSMKGDNTALKTENVSLTNEIIALKTTRNELHLHLEAKKVEIANMNFGTQNDCTNIYNHNHNVYNTILGRYLSLYHASSHFSDPILDSHIGPVQAPVQNPIQTRRHNRNKQSYQFTVPPKPHKHVPKPPRYRTDCQLGVQCKKMGTCGLVHPHQRAYYKKADLGRAPAFVTYENCGLPEHGGT
jgi:hypothetical protein